MKKSILVFCVIPVFLLLAGMATAAPITWNVNGHEYQIILSQGIGWSDARTAAQGLGTGWDLATITSVEEQNFINTIIPVPQTRTQYWIGGYQTVTVPTTPAANWNWVRDELWGYTNWDTSARQPDDWMGDQIYLALDSNTKTWLWDDNTNTLQFTVGYIAESAAPVPEPATMLLLGSGLLGLAGFRRKFFNK